MFKGLKTTFRSLILWINNLKIEHRNELVKEIIMNENVEKYSKVKVKILKIIKRFESKKYK